MGKFPLPLQLFLLEMVRTANECYETFYKPCEFTVMDCGEKGRGIAPDRDVDSGTVLLAFTGIVIFSLVSLRQLCLGADILFMRKIKEGNDTVYVYVMPERGMGAQLANHSCDGGNCATELQFGNILDKLGAVFLVAEKPIKRGGLIEYDYYSVDKQNPKGKNETPRGQTKPLQEGFVYTKCLCNKDCKERLIVTSSIQKVADGILYAEGDLNESDLVAHLEEVQTAIDGKRSQLESLFPLIDFLVKYIQQSPTDKIEQIWETVEENAPVDLRGSEKSSAKKRAAKVKELQAYVVCRFFTLIYESGKVTFPDYINLIDMDPFELIKANIRKPAAMMESIGSLTAQLRNNGRLELENRFLSSLLWHVAVYTKFIDPGYVYNPKWKNVQIAKQFPRLVQEDIGKLEAVLGDRFDEVAALKPASLPVDDDESHSDEAIPLSRTGRARRALEESDGESDGEPAESESDGGVPLSEHARAMRRSRIPDLDDESDKSPSDDSSVVITGESWEAPDQSADDSDSLYN